MVEEVLIPGYKSHRVEYSPHFQQEVNAKLRVVCDHPGSISDGYHTIDELYDHRHALFLLALKSIGGWKSLRHDDGTAAYDGWFVAGLTLKEPISYHLPMKFWDLCPATELDKAPPFDGYTSIDVLNRILEYIRE